MEEEESVDEIIEQMQSLLDDANPILPLDDIESKINDIEVPKFDFTTLSNLASLCLYCEDLLNKRPEVTNHTLFANLYRNFKREVNKTKTFVNNFENNSDKYISSKQCIKFARKLNNLLTQFEVELRNFGFL